jgi:hypothetical protein
MTCRRRSNRGAAAVLRPEAVLRSRHPRLSACRCAPVGRECGGIRFASPPDVPCCAFGHRTNASRLTPNPADTLALRSPFGAITLRSDSPFQRPVRHYALFPCKHYSADTLDNAHAFLDSPDLPRRAGEDGTSMVWPQANCAPSLRLCHQDWSARKTQSAGLRHAVLVVVDRSNRSGASHT